MKWRGPSQQSGLDDEVYLEKKVTEKAQREDVTKRVKDGSKQSAEQTVTAMHEPCAVLGRVN